MKRLLIFLALTLLPRLADAQQSYAYFSKSEVMKAMPEYAEAERGLSELRRQYADELARAEHEFNSKYEEFLEGQRTYAPSILKKRQAELRDLMERNIAFKQESDRLLQQAERQLLAPVNDKLHSLLVGLGEEQGYAFILDTDSGACPYVNPSVATDVTHIIKERAQER